MKANKNQKGATLVELIVALVVIGIAVAGFATVMSTNLNLLAEYSQDREEHLHKYRCCAETILQEPGKSVNKNECNDNSTFESDCCDELDGFKHEPRDEYCKITISHKNDAPPGDQIVLRLRCSGCNDDD